MIFYHWNEFQINSANTLSVLTGLGFYIPVNNGSDSIKMATVKNIEAGLGLCINQVNNLI